MELLDKSYAERQKLVILDDDSVEKLRKKESEDRGLNNKQELLLQTTVGVLAITFPFARGLLAPAVYSVVKAIANMNKKGFDVLTISRSEADQLALPPGHPRDDVLYIGHPVAPEKYYPAASFHRAIFEHKFCEAVDILMALGATEVKVEHVSGWSKEFSARLAGQFPEANTNVKGEAGIQSGNSSNLLFTASLSGTEEPSLPENLAWYHHEPTWQQIVEGRMNHNMLDFNMQVSYEDDFGVNAGLEVNAQKAGLDLGGDFQDHQSTVWTIKGRFKEKTE